MTEAQDRIEALSAKLGLTGYWDHLWYRRSDGVTFLPMGNGASYRPIFPCTSTGIHAALPGGSGARADLSEPAKESV